MNGPYDYRSTRAELSSSSPLHNLQAAFSSSPPLSPGSPTPASRRGVSWTARNGKDGLPSAETRRSVRDEGDEDDAMTSGIALSREGTLRSPSSSNPHPFSGSAKATLQSHPSFGKGQLRSKHLRSPQPSASEEAGQDGSGWVLPSNTSTKDVLASARVAQESVLAQHFHDSSDDYPSSDDPASTFSMLGSREGTSRSSQSSVHALHGARLGLGIQDLLGKDLASTASAPSSTLAAPFAQASVSRGPLARNTRVRTFSRTQSSSQDPFSAGAGSSALSPSMSAPADLSPRAKRMTQRRRLAGSSPKQLTRSESSRFLHGNMGSSGMQDSTDDSDDDGFDGASNSWDFAKHHSPLNSRALASAPAFDWREKIDTAFEKADGTLRLDDCGIMKIDPGIADLAKFVHVPRHRANEHRPGMSRAPSLANAGDRLGSAPIPNSNPNSPARATAAGQAAKSVSGSNLSSNVELYLARNSLRALPSALFGVTNLVVLSIRGNNIRELPAAIGELVNLRELNIAQNQLTYLPAEMQRLRLDGFYYFPNPFKQPPENSRLSARIEYGWSKEMPISESAAPAEAVTDSAQLSGTMLPPPVPTRLRSHPLLSSHASFAASASLQGTSGSERKVSDPTQKSTVTIMRYLEPLDEKALKHRLPTLVETCMRRLLREPLAEDIDEADSYWLSESSMLLEGHEADMLSKSQIPLRSKIVKALESARRSALGEWGRTRAPSESPWYEGLRAKPAPQRRQRRALGTPQLQYDSHTSFTPPPNHSMSSSEDLDGEASDELSAESGREGEEAPSAAPVSADVERDLDDGDDSLQNPWFNRCPNPVHEHTNKASPADADECAASAKDWPLPASVPNGGRHVYNEHCVERLEWVSHIGAFRVSGASITAINKDLQGADSKDQPLGPLARGSGCLPIRWRGCSPRCLDFLETAS